MRVIVPGELVVVTNMLEPRDASRSSSPTPYAGLPSGLIGLLYWTATVEHLTGRPYTGRAGDYDLLLWKGGWPKQCG